MPAEPKRGCGYRKVGALYLCGGGLSRPCDGMPIPMAPCPCCGFEIPFIRGLMRVSKKWFEEAARKHHKELEEEGRKCFCGQKYIDCPICFPENNDLEFYGLMWVGDRYYTPESFKAEGRSVLGISKRISQLPKWLELGKTWVVFAHQKVPKSDASFGENGLRKQEPETIKAVFYAFIPERIEMPIWKSEATAWKSEATAWKSEATAERIEELEKQGITPVIFEDNPENRKVHSEKRKVSAQRRL